jgi:membrane protease YdiL (CAAX protease family)
LCDRIVGFDIVPRADRSAVSSAALLSLPFCVALMVIDFVAPADAVSWSRADPILLILPQGATLALVPSLGVAAAIVWMIKAPSNRTGLLRAARYALLGAVTASLLSGLLRLVIGARLPAFIPSEESAGPGLLLGMTAGYGEEVLFRLIILPALFLRLPRARAPIAVAVTSVAFALLHVHPDDPAPLAHFATRLLLPGALMSVAFLAVEPSFIVTAHCTAHVLIPFLFS